MVPTSANGGRITAAIVARRTPSGARCAAASAVCNATGSRLRAPTPAACSIGGASRAAGTARVGSFPTGPGRMSSSVRMEGLIAQIADSSGKFDTQTPRGNASDDAVAIVATHKRCKESHTREEVYSQPARKSPQTSDSRGFTSPQIGLKHKSNCFGRAQIDGRSRFRNPL